MLTDPELTGAATSDDEQPGETRNESFADLVERLFHEFEDRYPLSHILEVVRTAQADLSDSPPRARPELVERLARQRLS